MYILPIRLLNVPLPMTRCGDPLCAVDHDDAIQNHFGHILRMVAGIQHVFFASIGAEIRVALPCLCKARSEVYYITRLRSRDSNPDLMAPKTIVLPVRPLLNDQPLKWPGSLLFSASVSGRWFGLPAQCQQ
jgi:hypothetical protein